MRDEDVKTLSIIASNCALPKVQRDALLGIIQREQDKGPVELQVKRGYHCMEDYCEPKHTDPCVLCKAAYMRGYRAGRM